MSDPIKYHKLDMDDANKAADILIAEALKVKEQRDELLSALETALLCIEDEVNLYAPDMCDAERVAEAKARHGEGGTLYYYAVAIGKAKDAIKKAKGL